jgi:hypothetical protein
MEVESNFKIKNAVEIGVINGIAPIITNSTTLVTNLNADLLDGNHATAFQTALVSGTNIKTINSQSLLGSGDIVITGGGGGSVTVTNISVNIPNTTSSANITISDALATTTSRIFVIPNGFTTGGLLGGDELEMSPLIVNAYCSVNGTINMLISSSQGPVKGTYGISYSIQ